MYFSVCSAAMMSSSVQTTGSSNSSSATQLSSSPITPQQQINSALQTLANRGVQVQVLSSNETQTSTNGTTSIANSSQEILAQLGGIRLGPEQRQQLLLATQLQQQLSSSSVVLQPTLQGVTLLPTTSVPAATAITTSSTGYDPVIS